MDNIVSISLLLEKVLSGLGTVLTRTSARHNRVVEADTSQEDNDSDIIVICPLSQRERDSAFHASPQVGTCSGRCGQERHNVTHIEAQSELCYDSVGLPEDKRRVVKFVDHSPAYTCVINSQPDDTFRQGMEAPLDFKEFLARPLELVSFDWTVGTAFSQTYSPWSAFLGNAQIANRINNFAGIRGKLHVKMMINGNGFHYGRILASYMPMLTHDIWVDDLHQTSNALDVITASQRPHVFLDPTTSTGGEMVLPFFYHKNALDLIESSNDLSGMGQLWLKSLNDLAHVNGSVGGVISITIMAWMEDVELVGPTSNNFTLISAQSEYAPDGLISKPATALADTAAALGAIPAIAPYARATEVAARSVATVSRNLGYSRPRILKDDTRVVPDYVGQIAPTDAADASVSLAIDSKQEVTHDPRVVGLGDTDELSIANICGRESYLTTFTWGEDATDPFNTTLWSCPICPTHMFNAIDNGVAANTLFQTPMCWVGSLFKQWTGPIKIRFQIVASAMHRGRLQIAWDAKSNTNPGASSRGTNTRYTTIVDISKERDFTIEVGWGSPKAYLNTTALGTNSLPVFTEAATPATFDVDTDNGVVAVRVLNSLSATSGTATTVSVNVFVSGPELAFRNPRNRSQLTYVAPASAVQDDGVSPDHTGDMEPEKSSEIEGMASDRANTHDLVYFGEHYDSLRTLMKRYSMYKVFLMTTALPTSPYLLQQVLPAMPLLRGTLNGTASLNNFCMVSYIAAVFKGWRGSLRHKFVPLFKKNNTLSDATMLVQRTDSIGFGFTNVAITTSPYQNAQASVNGGAHLTVVSQQPVISVEIPFYSAYRMQSTRDLDQDNYRSNLNLTTYAAGDGTNNAEIYMQALNASGEDFSLYFFAGIPRMWHTGGVP